MLKEFLEAALDGEMSSHLNDEERLADNKRNGRGSKRVKTMAGEIKIGTIHHGTLLKKKHVKNYHNTLESFGAFLQKAKEYCDSKPNQPKLIIFFSWSEWVEGSYLLPDKKNGFKLGASKKDNKWRV